MEKKVDTSLDASSLPVYEVSNAIGSLPTYRDKGSGSHRMRWPQESRLFTYLEISSHNQYSAFEIFHGMKSYSVRDEYGQIAPVYSISAGLDYPGGTEHALT